MLTILRTILNRDSSHLHQYVDYICIDRRMEGCKSFVDQLLLMNKLDDDILFLEDDIRLSPTQYEFILTVIKDNPDTLINFSSRKGRDGMYHSDTFQFTQCVYFPRRILRDIVNNLDVDDFLSCTHYDIALRKLLKEDYLSIFYTKAITDMQLHSVMKYY